MSRFSPACCILILIWQSCTVIFPAAPPNIPGLRSVPADFQFVIGIDVRQLTASPLYAALSQKKIGAKLAELAGTTGLDPARDVSYLILATKSRPQAKPAALLILAGSFDKSRIADSIRSKGSPAETMYENVPIWTLPEQKTDAVENGIAFLGEREIAVGDRESLKAASDANGGRKGSILSNGAIADLLPGVALEETFWFAGDAASALQQSPIPVPPTVTAVSIQSILGSFKVTEDVIGNVTATAADVDAAKKLADLCRAVLALGQVSGNQDADLKSLFRKVKISQDGIRVTMSLDIPGSIIEKLARGRDQQARQLQR
jgi:hypothetical protein